MLLPIKPEAPMRSTFIFPPNEPHELNLSIIQKEYFTEELMYIRVDFNEFNNSYFFREFTWILIIKVLLNQRVRDVLYNPRINISIITHNLPLI